MTGRLKFDRREFAGAFADLGTSLPLILAVLLATQLPAAGVLLSFGLAQIATGVLYGLPMPVQPLKAMAVVAIAGGASGGMLHLAGLMIGTIMVLLTMTGILSRLLHLIPRCVVRGLQLGLGLMLAGAACRLIGREQVWLSWPLAATAIVTLVCLRHHPRWPAGLLVVGAGIVWTALFRVDWQSSILAGQTVPPPAPEWPLDQWATVLIVLVIPQLPLSLGNSVLATHQAARDLFPSRAFTLRKIGLTYGFINLAVPWLGGLPVCHGCGGLVGNHAMGARSGGAVVIYGAFFVAAGLFGSSGFVPLAQAFPAPLLGALLVVEAGSLVALMGSERHPPGAVILIVLIGLICALAPQGYVLGMAVGLTAYHVLRACNVSMTTENQPGHMAT